MSAPWAENPAKLVIEWRKDSSGCKRRVQLSHTRAEGVPAQLQGRVDPKAYDALLQDCERLALEHPYVASASMDCCCQNLLGLCTFVVIGFGCFQGDAGDYDIWVQKVNKALAAHTPYFQQCGCKLSVQSVHGSFWVQVDVTAPPAAPMQYQGYAPQPQYAQYAPGPYAPPQAIAQPGKTF